MREREVGDARPAAHARPFTFGCALPGTTVGSSLVVPASRLPFLAPPIILIILPILTAIIVIILLVISDVMLLGWM